ncbi:MAG: M23 family metallopeptidase [Spirochaetaceae bacterium]|jgi:murein DD-endopeptidase MepM/ murein hydrolase activator NlpD|nr:M23 family metallopeptidase [Spirochaetaceae bacterium]
MNTVIAAQHVEHRKTPSLLSRTSVYRFSYKPLDQVKQTRARRKKSCPPVFPSLTPPLFMKQKKHLLPAAGLAGLVFFSLAALNWRGGDPSPYPDEDRMFEQHMAAYAGIFPSGPRGEAIPLDLMETFAWKSYTVRRGDSVSRIAANHATSMDAIIASNGITNAKRLKEGQVIRIPNMDGIPYTVKRGDSLLKISSDMGIPLEAILDANDIQSDAISPGTMLFLPGARMRAEDLRRALGDLFIYPIRGRLTSPFGWRRDPFTGERRYHAAVDLAANTGTPIKAAMDGRVSSVGVNSVYGKYVIITHGGGYQTMYAHMNVITVNQGVYVNQGSKIGEVGSTGYSTGPHLHFAVYKNGRAVNPLEYLNL